MPNKVSLDPKFVGLDEELKVKIDDLIEQHNLLSDSISDILEYESIIRFQDYYDANLDAKGNIDYFIKCCPKYDNNELILYAYYILEKEILNNLFFALEDEEGFELLNILDVYDIYDNALVLINFINDTLNNMLKETIDLSKVTNFVILPENVDEVTNSLIWTNTGKEKLSQDRGVRAVKLFSEISYNDKNLTKNIHKVIDNKKERNMKITDNSMLVERLGTGRTTRVIFVKLSLSSEVLNSLQERYNNERLENLYFTVYFGDFKCLAYDEHAFYDNVIKLCYMLESEIQEVVDLTSGKVNDLEKLISIVERSSTDLSRLSKDLNEELNSELY